MNLSNVTIKPFLNHKTLEIYVRLVAKNYFSVNETTKALEYTPYNADYALKYGFFKFCVENLADSSDSNSTDSHDSNSDVSSNSNSDVSHDNNSSDGNSYDNNSYDYQSLIDSPKGQKLFDAYRHHPIIEMVSSQAKEIAEYEKQRSFHSLDTALSKFIYLFGEQLLKPNPAPSDRDGETS